jgi:hypothetical protein
MAALLGGVAWAGVRPCRRAIVIDWRAALLPLVTVAQRSQNVGGDTRGACLIRR